MITGLILTTLWMIVNATLSKNPMKICLTIIAASLIVFAYIYILSGITWFPLIIYILFTGGILIIFIVVSSVRPNKKLDKEPIKPMVIILMATLILITVDLRPRELKEPQINQVKWFLNKKETLTGIIVLIIRYFASFITFLSKHSTSLRTILCHLNANFVNWLKNKWQF